MKVMFKSFMTKGQKGFSLVELMIVVAIIGILAALAVPKFQSFQAKARQTEGKNNLSHVYTLQMSYHGDNDTYSAVTTTGRSGCNTNPLGFTVTGCGAGGKARYSYTSTGGANAFLATANAAANVIVTGCPTADTWTIDQNKLITPTSDAVAKCG